MPAISVKVSVKKVIAAMEAKIAENTKKLNEFEKAEKAEEEAKKKHEAFVQANAYKIASKSGVKPTISVQSARSWGEHAGKVQVEVTYYLTPEDAEALMAPKPDKRYEGIHPSMLKEQNEELGNAVRLLKMTDEEYVSTATYKSVAKYL